MRVAMQEARQSRREGYKGHGAWHRRKVVSVQLLHASAHCFLI